MKIDEFESILQGLTNCCPVCRDWYEENGDSVHHFLVPVDKEFPMGFHYELENPRRSMAVHNECDVMGLAAFLRENLKHDNRIIVCEGREVLALKEQRRSNSIEEIIRQFVMLYQIVNPLVQEYKQHFSSLYGIINAFSDVYKKEKDRIPFSFNVIDELHINENGHSRVLAKLLQYRSGGRYPILESFIELLRGRCQREVNIVVEKPDISNERNRIDALVVEHGKYAVIIENKIYWANDQEKQIDRYVNFVKGYGFEKDDSGVLKNVFVVYLTQDGTKEVTHESFDQARKSLGWKSDEDKGQFIPLNYKDDILPWLRDVVLPNCTLKEDILSSGIRQYVDFLEGMFCIRQSQVVLFNNMKDLVYNECGLKEGTPLVDRITTVKSVIRKTDDWRKILDTCLNQMMTFVGQFENLTRQIFKECYSNGKWVISNYTQWDQGYFQIRRDNWHPNVHLEWLPLSHCMLLKDKDYKLVLHIERDARKGVGDIVKEKICQEEPVQNGEIDQYAIKTYHSAKPFALMTDDEQKVFLDGIYNSNEVHKMVAAVDSAYKSIGKAESNS